MDRACGLRFLKLNIMNKKELRVALLGTGFMGKAHSNAWCQAGHYYDLPWKLRRSLVCGNIEAELEQIAKQWEWEETASDWRAAIDRKDIDAIDIALPNHLHAPAAIAAAEAGKIVLCEKPLALSAEEAQTMVGAARGVPTLVWYNYRRVPAVAYARQLIDEGRLGNIFHYNATYFQQWGADTSRPATWRMDPKLAGAGVGDDLLTHSLDLAMFLNGRMSEGIATSRTFAPGRAVDDAISALVNFDNGSLGRFEASRFGIGCKNANAFAIHGSGGMLRFNLEDLNRLEFLDASEPSVLQGCAQPARDRHEAPDFSELLATGTHHRLRTYVHRGAGGVYPLPRERPGFSPELRRCPGSAGSAGRAATVGENTPVDADFLFGVIS